MSGLKDYSDICDHDGKERPVRDILCPEELRWYTEYVLKRHARFARATGIWLFTLAFGEMAIILYLVLRDLL